MKKLYTIGEMAKIHAVPIRTLRYYDSFGLFKPATVDAESGYRYYSTQQFEELNTIKYLKFLGLSLKEIKAHLTSRDADGFLGLLKKQRHSTLECILRLQTIERQLNGRIVELESALAVKALGEVVLKKLPDRFASRIDGTVSSEAEWEMALSRLERLSKGDPSLFIGKVGFVFSKENLRSGRFAEYEALLIMRDEPHEGSDKLTLLPAGDYLCVSFRGGRDKAPQYYRKLQEFIDANRLLISGDAIERIIIDEYITQDEKLHLSEIQLPVQKKLDSPVTGEFRMCVTL